MSIVFEVKKKKNWTIKLIKLLINLPAHGAPPLASIETTQRTTFVVKRVLQIT